MPSSCNPKILIGADLVEDENLRLQCIDDEQGRTESQNTMTVQRLVEIYAAPGQTGIGIPLPRTDRGAFTLDILAFI
jgi:hypothetical protein